MKFPLSVLDETEYNNQLNSLIADPNCKYFFDTNLFSQLFKTYPSAREEFYVWVDEQIVADRVRISSWSMNEYVNRFITSKLGDYTGDIKKAKTINKELENLRDFLKMYIDDKNLENTIYPDRDAYFQELDLVVEKFGKITKATKEISDYWNGLNSEFSARFEPVIIKSDIYSIIQDIHKEAQIRFQNYIPPGYKDDDKSENKHGDLIIWKEILEYCKKNAITKAILVTNDGKKDLVYQPLKLKSNGRTIPNKSYQLADPRLVYEFNQYTGSNDLMIIKFSTLVQALWKQDNGKFSKLSQAIQISDINELRNVIPASAQGDEELDTTNVIVPGESVVIVEPPIVEPVPEVPNPIQDLPVEPVAIPLPELGYSEKAIADKDFEFSSSNRLSEIVEKLKTYTWDVQNSGIAMLYKAGINQIEQNQENKDYLFVIGRNIYQAACGNAFNAIEFIRELKNKLMAYNEFVRENLLNGILFEIYFNSAGLLRSGNFKVAYIDDVFKIQTVPAFRLSIEFIRRALQPYDQQLIVKPNEVPEMANIIIFHEDAPAEEMVRIQNLLITNITANGRQIFCENREEIDEWHNPLRHLFDDKLVSLIVRTFAIPPSQITINLSPEIENVQRMFNIPDDRKLGIELPA